MTTDRSKTFDIEVFNHLFTSVAEEMGVAVQQSSYSPNIKERLDHSCAIFDRSGKMLAQAAHIPVHLGSMPASVSAAIESYGKAKPASGDVLILNDPYMGGTHLPDITTVSPVFVGRRTSKTQWGWVATRAHHADIGGMAPGSMPVAKELIQEGLIIPPIRIYDAGKIVHSTLSIILRNVRTPDERRGDLEAQVACQKIGIKRLANLAEKEGYKDFELTSKELLNYGERISRAAIKKIPNGSYEFKDMLDEDGTSTDPVPIHLTLHVRSSNWHLDFSKSSHQRSASINAVAAVTRSAAYYVLRCLLPDDVPTNSGLFRPVRFTLPLHSIVNASPPVAVAAGNVETSQRIVDVIWGAISQALPLQMPAASSGTMNNFAAGGVNPETNVPWTYYETIGGGHGGAPDGPGLDAAQSHMTNTLNTPVESLEIAYPMQVVENSIRRGSGGKGVHRGGHGIIRRTRFLSPATVTIISDRRLHSPWPAAGGEPGRPGRNQLERHGKRRKIPGKKVFDAMTGDVVRIETPGGGGWGKL